MFFFSNGEKKSRKNPKKPRPDGFSWIYLDGHSFYQKLIFEITSNLLIGLQLPIQIELCLHYEFLPNGCRIHRLVTVEHYFFHNLIEMYRKARPYFPLHYFETGCNHRCIETDYIQ